MVVTVTVTVSVSVVVTVIVDIPSGTGVTGTILICGGPAGFVDGGCGGGFALLASDVLGAGAGARADCGGLCCGVDVRWIVGTSSDVVCGAAVAVVSAMLTAGDEALSADGEAGAPDDGGAGGVAEGVMVMMTMVGSNAGEAGLADGLDAVCVVAAGG